MTHERPVKLLNRLEELGITRQALAEAVGVDVRNVYRWLSYKSEPRLTLIQSANLCRLLQWTAEQLADAYYPSGNVLPITTEAEGEYVSN